MRAKVNKLEEDSKNKNIRKINKGVKEFKIACQARYYVIKKYYGANQADTATISSSLNIIIY